MKYKVEVRYRYKYDVSTALPGIESFFSKEELAEERVCSDWDYVFTESAQEAIAVFTKRIVRQTEENKLCEKYDFRFTEVRAVEVPRKKPIDLWCA